MPHIVSYPCDRDICSCCRYQPFILIYNTKNITISGNGKKKKIKKNYFNICFKKIKGSIDGNGEVWWERFRGKTLEFGRPRLLESMQSSYLKILNVTLKNSPFWTVHLWDSENIEVSGAHVLGILFLF